MSVDLSTKYLGLTLKNPVVLAACPLTERTDLLKRFEDAGAAAAVLPSLFEEQIVHDDVQLFAAHEVPANHYAESTTYFPEQDDYRFGTDSYLEKIEAAKKAVSFPIIASLNGTSKGGWISYAKKMEEAGADALELNIYFIAADIDESGQDVERRYVDLVAAVKQSIGIPLAVKIGPYFSSPGNVARKLVEAGADGLVLFNRFLQPDIDLVDLNPVPRIQLSTSFEALLPIRWLAILKGRVNASLALTSGIHGYEDLLKGLLAGADVGMLAAALYEQGAGVIGRMITELADWMAEREYSSVEQLKGSVSQQNCADPAAFERGNYMKALTSFNRHFA